MDRRAFLATLTGGLLTAPLAAEAQPAGKVWRIGCLGNSSAALESELVAAFRQGLRDLGYVDGRNIVIEDRWAEGQLIGSLGSSGYRVEEYCWDSRNKSVRCFAHWCRFEVPGSPPC